MRFFTRDLRLAVRSLFATRRFLLLVVGAIALGVGANTTIFSVLNPLVLKPLPFPEPDRLVYLDEQTPERGTVDWMSTSYPDFADWRAQSRSFSGMAAFRDAAFDLSGGGEAERASGAVVSESLFRVLGVRPLLGRGFTAGEGAPGAPAVVVLSHGLWTRRFGGDREVLGKSMRIDGTGHTVVGVMPAGFSFPEFAELWVPLRAAAAASRGDRTLAVVGRLEDGVDVERAAGEIATINWRLAEAHPETNDGVTAVVKPLHETLRGDTSHAALLFQGLTLLVLAIAWTNVANLLLARSMGRRKEIAVRSALGATRGHILRQLVAEGVVLAGLGGVAGLVLGFLGRGLLVSAIPIQLPFWIDFSFDWRVLAFAAGLTLAGVFFFALAPALQLGRVELQEVLKAGGRGTTDARAGGLQGGLVVAETALALVLMVGAGMLAKSLVTLQAVDPGFRTDGVATARLALPERRYPGPREQAALWDELTGRVAAIAGVEGAAAVGILPLGGGGRGSEIAIEGRTASADGEAPFALPNPVSREYFRVMRIPLRAGRAFDGTERPDGRPVIVVNETMAARWWPGESAVGKRVRFGNGDGAPWREVVGVVGDVKDTRVAAPAWPTVYLPLPQAALPFGRLVVRTRSGDPADVVPAVRAELRRIDPDLPMDQAWTLAEVALRSMWLPRLYAWLAGVFALIALGLSSLGIYGILSYTVRQRTQEIGIRTALGATPRAVRALFVVRGARLAGLAVALGLPAAWALTRLLGSLLYGAGGADLLVFAGVPTLLLAVALVASLVPAHAATRVEPSVALRHD